MYKLNLDEIDPSGAIAEHHAAVEGDTRMDFLKKAGLGGAAAVSGGAVLSGLTAGTASAQSSTRPPSMFGKGDIGILNYALTLEFLEAAFYNEATKNNVVADGNSQLAVFLRTVTRDENRHVGFLRSGLGSKAVKRPKFNFGDTTKDPTMFALTSEVLENTGVSAYLGQAKNIRSAKILGQAGSILTVEARHASVIGVLNKNSSDGIAPDGAFDRAKSARAILAAVKKTGFIVDN